MSYSEFVSELKLENRVIAVTRVNSADEKTDDIFGCVYKALKKVMEGKSLVLKKRFVQLRRLCSQQRT